MTEESLKTAPEVEEKISKELEVPVKPKDTSDDGKATSEYKINVIKDYYGRVDIWHLNKKDPNFHYRFLRADTKNLSIKTTNLLFQKGGWQIVPRSHLVNKLGIEKEYISPEGSLKRGDCVLAFMPKKLWLEKEKHKEERANEPMRRVERNLKDGMSTDVPGIRIKPKKDLQGNWKN